MDESIAHKNIKSSNDPIHMFDLPIDISKTTAPRRQLQRFDTH
jgi:hypothetical protein